MIFIWKWLLENLNTVRFSVSLREDNLIQGTQFCALPSQLTGKEIIIREVNIPQLVICCTSESKTLNSSVPFLSPLDFCGKKTLEVLNWWAFFRTESLSSTQLITVPSLTLLTTLFTLYILNTILLFTHLPFLLTVCKCPVAPPAWLTFNANQALEWTGNLSSCKSLDIVHLLCFIWELYLKL